MWAANWRCTDWSDPAPVAAWDRTQTADGGRCVDDVVVRHVTTTMSIECSRTITHTDTQSHRHTRTKMKNMRKKRNYVVISDQFCRVPELLCVRCCDRNVRILSSDRFVFNDFFFSVCTFCWQILSTDAKA